MNDADEALRQIVKRMQNEVEFWKKSKLPNAKHWYACSCARLDDVLGIISTTIGELKEK